VKKKIRKRRKHKKERNDGKEARKIER